MLSGTVRVKRIPYDNRHEKEPVCKVSFSMGGANRESKREEMENKLISNIDKRRRQYVR